MSEREVINICFHGVGTPMRKLEEGEARYWVTIFQFESILDEIVEWPSVQISFDDGNCSDFELGLPALLKRDLKATFFVLAGRLESTGSLDADNIRELHEAGMTIGNHGMDHRSWRSMDSTTRKRELVEARNLISVVTGSPVDQVALPMGQYDRHVLKDLRRVAYRTVHTSDRRPARTGGWLQPRFSVRSDDSPHTLRAAVAASRSPIRHTKLVAIGLAKQLR